MADIFDAEQRVLGAAWTTPEHLLLLETVGRTAARRPDWGEVATTMRAVMRDINRSALARYDETACMSEFAKLLQTNTDAPGGAEVPYLVRKYRRTRLREVNDELVLCELEMGKLQLAIGASPPPA